MAALDFPPSSESPFIAPNGVVYVWNDDGYWEADTSEVPSSDNTFLKLDLVMIQLLVTHYHWWLGCYDESNFCFNNRCRLR